MKVGLIMIGGSLKGIYGHTGIISALQYHKIKPDIILGASAGSIVASLYASGRSLTEMYNLMLKITAKDFLDPMPKWEFFYEFIFNKAQNFTGFLKGVKLEEYMRKNLAVNDFSETKIPLYIAATNLGTYELNIFKTGTISDKVQASSAIPMMFSPKKIHNEYYIDGAVVKDRLPYALAEAHPELDLIIISNFSHEPVSIENEYIEGNKLPILEIVRRTLSMHEHSRWPKKIGSTNVIYIKPGVRIPVDIFHPDKQLARAVYHEACNYTKHFLEKALAKFK